MFLAFTRSAGKLASLSARDWRKHIAGSYLSSPQPSPADTLCLSATAGAFGESDPQPPDLAIRVVRHVGNWLCCAPFDERAAGPLAGLDRYRTRHAYMRRRGPESVAHRVCSGFVGTGAPWRHSRRPGIAALSILSEAGHSARDGCSRGTGAGNTEHSRCNDFYDFHPI